MRPRLRDENSVLNLCRKHLSYDPDSGIFSWILPTSRRVKIGDTAGSEMSNGYINIRLFGNQILAHRLALAWLGGRFLPRNPIDHINGVRRDNRLANLRLADKARNGQNACKPRHGVTSRFKGVHWDKSRNKWTAQICDIGRREFLGRFDSEEAAAGRYDSIAMIYFGHFARPNGDVYLW